MKKLELKPWDVVDHLTTREDVELYLADAVPTSKTLDELRRHLQNAVRALDRMLPPPHPQGEPD
jgi:DNA-binding phage protein